ncbi:DNA-binding response regulator, NarL/FixJ family, contains REC and HTH domains [Pedobacter steynii]|uniref:DNA-binding response regulator, NarL/FixJ family, contains REC and HTH domains n=1 Tax=Pedobacter steynii TaxID=430522 RepID=A0A1G9UZB5_9SPHI|nr:response regulator transcription factor [Pedobacter steynii]NQX40930.1 response regulator transcription factor [Pedobacter steynii]SDM65294.1 DNA-binding response regulator, NarL/FixJ family, contains REC and HTH domains [Pedobacter steynii]
MKISIGIVDDHQLFLKSLVLMLHTFKKYEVVVQAINGLDLQEKIKLHDSIPEIMLIDVNMPVMDGIATASWLNQNYPAMKLVALSMNDTDKTIIEMIKAGCCAYLLKDTHPNDLEKALNEIQLKGYYNADVSNINFRRLLNYEQDLVKLNEKEKTFLQLACSDLTYKQIAALMFLSERTIDGYRESLFQKLNVQSRVGMALEAIRKGFVKL